MQFSKEDVAYLNMCSDLLIDKIIQDVWFRDSCSEKFVIFAKEYPWGLL